MDFGGVERAWRRSWMRGIGSLSSGASVETAPDWDSRPWKVLYMRAQGIGDVILATGVLRAIARSHPTITLDALTTQTAAPVLANNPHVRRVHTLTRTTGNLIALARMLARERYDVVIEGKITRGASFIRSPVFTMVSRARYRIGVAGGNHAAVFNVCVPAYDRSTTHIVDGSAALAIPFGVQIDATDFRPEIVLTAQERARAEGAWMTAARALSTTGDRWLVNISAGSASRRWSDERWIALVAHLRSRRPRATIAVIGVGSDSASIQRIAVEAGAVAIPATRLRDAFALVGTSARVMTCDTSITHAASAFSVPTVLLLESGLDQWSSWNTPSENAYWSGASVNELDVDSARAALDRFLIRCDSRLDLSAISAS
jgi:ADP-heptose:LPS heptosyltransferase